MIVLLGYVLLFGIYSIIIYSIVTLGITRCSSGRTESEISRSSDNLLVWGWAINPDRKKMEDGSKRFLDTSNKFGFNSELIGIGYTLERHQGQDRFYVLRDRLQGVKDNQIVLVMDTFDTLMNGRPDEVLRRFKRKHTRILFSAEKAYTFQYMENQHYFMDELSEYRYLAAGTYIGYAGDIRKMNDDCIRMLEGDDGLKGAAEMGIMGMWLGERIKDRELCRLDSKCDIFWVTSDDSESFHSKVDSNGKIDNPATGTVPIVFHVVGATAPDPRSDYYQKAYEKIMRR